MNTNETTHAKAVSSTGLLGLSDSVMDNLPADVRHSIKTAGLNYPPMIKRVNELKKKLGEKI